jgi:hypothetical protein
MRRPENDQSKNKPSRSRREGWLTKADPKFLILPSSFLLFLIRKVSTTVPPDRRYNFCRERI